MRIDGSSPVMPCKDLHTYSLIKLHLFGVLKGKHFSAFSIEATAEKLAMNEKDILRGNQASFNAHAH